MNGWAASIYDRPMPVRYTIEPMSLVLEKLVKERLHALDYYESVDNDAADAKELLNIMSRRA